MAQTIVNSATGETATFLETSRETGGKRTAIEVDVKPLGGVPVHRHGDHDEFLEVVAGEIEVTMNGTVHRLGPGEHILIPRGTTHLWRNPSTDRDLKFRGAMTPGHPDFEIFLHVFYGLGSDGELGANKLPKRFSDLALLGELDPSVFVGMKRLLRPIMKLVAARARKRGREAELLRRYVDRATKATRERFSSIPKGL